MTFYKGRLEGIGIDQLKKLDYETKRTLNERKDYLEEKHSRVEPFYETFTSEVYNSNITEKQPLSHEINIFKYLERDGSYLLTSEDVKREKHIVKSLSEYDLLLNMQYGKHGVNFDVAIETSANTNTTQYVNIETIITTQDFKNKQYGDYLKSYKKTKDLLKKEMARIKNKEGSIYSLTQIMKMLNAINVDMELVKQYHTEIVQYDIKSKNIGFIGEVSRYTNVIDYCNKDHISALLKSLNPNQPIEPNNELSHIAYDLRCMLDNLRKTKILSDEDIRLINLVRETDLTMEQIAKIMLITRKTIYNRFNSIINKICDYNEKKGCS